MVMEAVKALGGTTTNVDVRDWIMKKYPGTFANTIACQIIAMTVNHASRIHYAEGSRPRVASTENPQDKLFRIGTGKLAIWNPAKHGAWSIIRGEDGKLAVVPGSVGTLSEPRITVNRPISSTEGDCFAAETHLRDYLAQNLSIVEAGLELFATDDGVSGVEFIVDVGRIDILARDRSGNFVVIELKVSRGPDEAAGQILRYVNWVRKHMAKGGPVRGFLIAQAISDKIRYAIASDPEIRALQYQISMKIVPVDAV